MKRFRSVAMLLAIVTGLLVILLVSGFATAALNAYARKEEARHTLAVVRRTTQALFLKEAARIELGVMDAAIQAREPASALTMAQIAALHARSEKGLNSLGREYVGIGKLRARIAEVQRRRDLANKARPTAIASLLLTKDMRSNAKIAVWRDGMLAMMLALDAWSNDHSDTTVNADSFVDEMMKINALAWNMRAVAGADRRNLALAIVEGGMLPIEQRVAFADAGGRVGALWTQIEGADHEHSFQPRLKRAFETARQTYLVGFMGIRKDIIARLARGEPVLISGQEWLRISNPGLNSIIAISKNALAITEWHAAELAHAADRNFQIALGYMLASIIMASSAMAYVMWRVIAPLKSITRAMRSIAGGDLAREIPYGHRQDEIGQFAGALRMFRDSAVARQMLETELLRNRAAREAAETSNRLKSEFLANMSHELRTPLNAILGFSEMIEAEVLGPGLPQYRVYAGDIHSAGAHLLSLINDILDLSKAEAGQLDLRCETFDMADLIRECARLVSGRAEKQNLHIHLAAFELPPLFADRLRVKQVLINIFSNAIKFTPEGGKVSVDAVLDGDGMLAVRVCDTGIGIAPEMIPLAFEPFRQVDSVLSRKFEGTGLGLSLVKSLMTLHQGSVAVQSVLGKGTVVTLVFPKSRCMETSPQEQVPDLLDASLPAA